MAQLELLLVSGNGENTNTKGLKITLLITDLIGLQFQKHVGLKCVF